MPILILPEPVTNAVANQIKKLAPDLDLHDIYDLLDLKPRQLRDVLGDYIAAKKLNKPQLNAIIKFFRSLAKFAEMAGAIATLV